MNENKIKFRAWDIKNKCMINNALIIGNIGLGEGSVVVDSRVQNGQELYWMQDTGLDDLNSKDIHVGDILKARMGNRYIIGKMLFNYQTAQFTMVSIIETKGKDNSDLHIVSKAIPEIIGNIYENPELLIDNKI